MAHWLSAAKAAFQKQTAKEPERFEIRCSCGTMVGGVRTREPQQVACPTCNQILLALPESLYPLPKPPRQKKPKPPEKPKSSKSGSIKTAAPATTKSSPAAAPAVTPQPTVPGRSAANAKTAAGEAAKKVFNKRHFTPLRIVIVLMFVALGMTGYWMLRQRERDLANQTLTEALKVGRKALEEDDLPEADAEFRRAVQALDVLGRRDASAQGTRQTARELTVMNQLVAKSLRDLLAEAAETTVNGNSAAWPDIFRASYRDRWIVLDTQVTPQPPEDPQAPSEFLIDLPVAAGENRLVVILKTRALSKVAINGAPRRMILAGRLQDCVQDPGQPGTWRLELDETSPFHWTDASLLVRLGWTRESTLEKLLEEQARLEGLER